MKLIYTFIFTLFSMSLFSQNADYKVSSYKNLDLDPEKKAPNTHYIGSAWLRGLVGRNETDLNFGVTLATFKKNSTLNWHTHSSGQVLIIVDGNAYYQERGKEVIVLKEGDVVKCDKETEHWHSSTSDSDVSYIAIYGGSTPTTWTEEVTKEYYDSIDLEAAKQRNQ